MDLTLLVIAAIAFLMVIWLIGLIRRIGGCLIHLALLAAGGLLIYALYIGAISLPL